MVIWEIIVNVVLKNARSKSSFTCFFFSIRPYYSAIFHVVAGLDLSFCCRIDSQAKGTIEIMILLLPCLNTAVLT